MTSRLLFNVHDSVSANCEGTQILIAKHTLIWHMMQSHIPHTFEYTFAASPSNVHLVKGRYEYYHYKHNDFNDCVFMSQPHVKVQ